MEKFQIIKGVLHIDGIKVIKRVKYLCGTIKHEENTWVNEEECSYANLMYKEEYPHQVNSFKYNGFYGSSNNKILDYKAKFKEWTNDPGIAVFNCSDGQERKIPTFAINISFILPQQTYKDDNPDLFGDSLQE